LFLPCCNMLISNCLKFHNATAMLVSNRITSYSEGPLGFLPRAVSPALPRRYLLLKCFFVAESALLQFVQSRLCSSALAITRNGHRGFRIIWKLCTFAPKTAFLGICFRH